MIREIFHNLGACILTFALCAVAYPAVVWGVARVAFRDQAEGSLIRRADGVVIGSALVAQPFASDRYFRPRPSAVGYNASATGASNLGTKNPSLHDQVAERAKALGASDASPVPADLVTASGAGLDPDISPEAALFQADRVAKARQIPIDRVRALIDDATDRFGGLIGAPARVNVLRLNLALDVEPIGLRQSVSLP